MCPTDRARRLGDGELNGLGGGGVAGGIRWGEGHRQGLRPRGEDGSGGTLAGSNVKSYPLLWVPHWDVDDSFDIWTGKKGSDCPEAGALCSSTTGYACSDGNTTSCNNNGYCATSMTAARIPSRSETASPTRSCSPRRTTGPTRGTTTQTRRATRHRTHPSSTTTPAR